MSSTYYNLIVSNRSKFGTKESKKIRKNGFIPAVLYYAGEKNIHIYIEKSVLFHALQSSQRIYEIDQNNEKQYVMIKEIQYHPVTDEIIHIDLMRVRRSEKMTIAVPLVLTGDPVGVKEGGILSQSLNQVEISCYPTDIPENIELNIEDLELNSAKSIGDLEINIKDVEIVSDSTLNIVSITPPATEEEVIEEEMDQDDVEESLDGSEDSIDDQKGEEKPNENKDEKSKES